MSRTKRTTAHRRAAIVPVAAVAALLLAACGGGGNDAAASSGAAPSGADGLTAVTVGVIPIIDVAPVYLGIEQGIFEDHGLEVTASAGQGGAAIVPGVVSGDIQFGFGNSMSVAIGASKGLPLQIIASGVWTPGDPEHDPYTVMSADAGITRPADLEGKTVAVNTLNSSGDSAIIRTVEADGGDPSSINFVEMPFTSMSAAMTGGDIDAAWIVEPFVTQAKDVGAHVVYPLLASLSDEDAFEVSTYFTTSDYIAQNPEIVEEFQAAVAEANSYANDNPDEVRRILDTYLELPEGLSERVLLPAWRETASRTSVEIYASLAEDRGLLESEVDVDALLSHAPTGD